jgi:hypothetical protein
MKKGEAGLNRLLGIYKRGAKSRKLDFNLSVSEFKTLTSGRCYFCNALPSMEMVTNKNHKNKISHWGDYTYNGVDRIDNGVGYVDGNCVPCCTICNWAKSGRTAQEFKRYIQGICENAIAGTIPCLQS